MALKQAMDREKLKFLVADDMVNMRGTIRNMLKHLGYRHIREAEDGHSAWIKLKAEKADIAVVDWNMPNVNGIELLRKTRADRDLESILFIMVTAEVSEETIAEAAETEVDAYIIKPFVAKTLEEKILQVLERKNNPSPLEKMLRAAEMMTEAGQYNEAVRELKKSLLLYPNNPRVFLGFGELYRKRGMFEDAEKAYKKALLTEPKFMKAYDGLAAVYEGKGDEKRLMVILKNAVDVSPKNASRQTILGKALLENGLTGEAVRAFQDAARAEPRNVSLKRELGELLLEKDLDNEAVEMFQSILKEYPEDIHVYNRLGIAYRKQGKYGEAIEEYEKALRISRDDENIYYNLGRAYLEAGHTREAAVQFREALAKNPGFEEARGILEELAADQSRE